MSIHSSVRIGSDVLIEDFVYWFKYNLSNNVIIYSGPKIGKNCKIGLGSIIHSNVVLYDKCEIGIIVLFTPIQLLVRMGLDMKIMVENG